MKWSRCQNLHAEWFDGQFLLTLAHAVCLEGGRRVQHEFCHRRMPTQTRTHENRPHIVLPFRCACATRCTRWGSNFWRQLGASRRNNSSPARVRDTLPPWGTLTSLSAGRYVFPIKFSRFRAQCNNRRILTEATKAWPVQWISVRRIPCSRFARWIQLASYMADWRL